MNFPTLYNTSMKKLIPFMVPLAVALALIGFSVQVHAATAKVTASATIIQPVTVTTTGTTADSNNVISQVTKVPGTDNTVQVTIEFN